MFKRDGLNYRFLFSVILFNRALAFVIDYYLNVEVTNG